MEKASRIKADERTDKKSGEYTYRALYSRTQIITIRKFKSPLLVCTA